MTAQPVENPGENEDPGTSRTADSPEAPGTADSPPDTAPDPDETTAPADTAEEPGEVDVVQPADAVDPEDIGKVVALRTPKGSLTLDPFQTEPTAAQAAALVAIGIDTKGDPGVIPHIAPFIHMCQVRDLDPYMREAYLIGRGKGEKRKWTMQVAIDGYRKMAEDTGKFRRVKKRLWTGRDDDPTCWRDVEDEDGDVIRQRVWYDQWPESKGYPGAAKVVIEHYDQYGRLTTTSAIADWNFYAPYNDVWENTQGGRRPKKDADGKVVQELSDMWRKGFQHMLSKCAEALALRSAFPRQMSGTYVHEEMHRADQMERNRIAAESRRALVAAHEASKPVKPIPAQRQPAEPAPAPEQASPEAPSGPMPLGETAREVVDALTAQGKPPEAAESPVQPTDDRSPEVRAALLRKELDFIGSVLVPDRDEPGRFLATRAMKGLKKDLDAFTDAELLTIVTPLRTPAAARLEKDGRGGDATAYRDVAPDEVIDVGDLFADDPASDPRLDADPTKRHEYVKDGDTCAVCGRFEDELPHPPKADG